MLSPRCSWLPILGTAGGPRRHRLRRFWAETPAAALSRKPRSISVPWSFGWCKLIFSLYIWYQERSGMWNVNLMVSVGQGTSFFSSRGELQGLFGDCRDLPTASINRLVAKHGTGGGRSWMELSSSVSGHSTLVSTGSTGSTSEGSGSWLPAMGKWGPNQRAPLPLPRFSQDCCGSSLVVKRVYCMYIYIYIIHIHIAYIVI